MNVMEKRENGVGRKFPGTFDVFKESLRGARGIQSMVEAIIVFVFFMPRVHAESTILR
jgi:hypothetical protein